MTCHEVSSCVPPPNVDGLVKIRFLGAHHPHHNERIIEWMQIKIHSSTLLLGVMKSPEKDRKGVEEINYGDISPQPEIRAAAGSIQVQRSLKKVPPQSIPNLTFSLSLF